MKLLVTGGLGFIGSNFIRYTLTKYKNNTKTSKQQPNKKQNPKNKHFNSTETQKKLHNHTLKDLIHVKDVAKANLNALEHNNANYQAINIDLFGKALKKLKERHLA